MKMNFEYIKEFNKDIEHPKGVPENWVVNPINNVAIEFITKKNKDRIHTRENWVNPEALIKVLENRYKDTPEKEIPIIKERNTNQFYLDLEQKVKDSEKQ
tara:strand:- start:245 stop:544 length:300 start_codon:yes stop_codon:yes gene_type:complete